MKSFVSTLCAAVIAFTPIATVPARAASTALPWSAGGSAGPENLVQVQHRWQNDRSRSQRGINEYRDQDRRFRQDGRGYDRRGSRPDPRRPRPVERQSRGPDLPSALLGAIVGGIIVNQYQSGSRAQAPVGLSQRHIDWCRDRWRSYRVSDNSYQPYQGPRRVCVSPY